MTTTPADELRAAVLSQALPEWEAMYEPGNVSDYLIGYANTEAAAKGAAIAWVLSQSDKDPARLEWVEQGGNGRDNDHWDELIEQHDDGIDTAVGVTVRHRCRPYTAADVADPDAPEPEQARQVLGETTTVAQPDAPLKPTEREFLTYALDLPADKMASVNGFTDEDEEAQQPPGAEQAAAINWKAIVRQRERELKAVGEARHAAETETERLRGLLWTKYGTTGRLADEAQQPTADDEVDDTLHACPGGWAGPNCRCFDTDDAEQPAPAVTDNCTCISAPDVDDSGAVLHHSYCMVAAPTVTEGLPTFVCDSDRMQMGEPSAPAVTEEPTP